MLREELQMLRFNHNRLSEISQAAWDSANGQLNIRINTNDMETSIDSNSNPEARTTEQLTITNVVSTSNTTKDPEPTPKGPPVLAKDLFTKLATRIWWGETTWKGFPRVPSKDHTPGSWLKDHGVIAMGHPIMVGARITCKM